MIELVLNAPCENCDPLIVLTKRVLTFAVHAPSELVTIELVVRAKFAMFVATIPFAVIELTRRVLNALVIAPTLSELTFSELTDPWSDTILLVVMELAEPCWTMNELNCIKRVKILFALIVLIPILLIEANPLTTIF